MIILGVLGELGSRHERIDVRDHLNPRENQLLLINIDKSPTGALGAINIPSPMISKFFVTFLKTF